MIEWREIGRLTAIVGLFSATGCASSARLAEQGNLPAACRKARGEPFEQHVVLRQRVFALVAPRVVIEMVDPETSRKLQSLVGNRYEATRFARVSVVFDPNATIEARMDLEDGSDRQAYFTARTINDSVAADLVYPRPVGPHELGILGEGFLKATVNASALGLCAAAGAGAGCLGFWMDGDDDTARGTLAWVNAHPEFHERKMKLLAAAKIGCPLVVFLPSSTRPEATVVRLNFVLRSWFGEPGNRCSYNERVVVELKGNELEPAIARELTGPARSLQSLNPTLTYGP